MFHEFGMKRTAHAHDGKPSGGEKLGEGQFVSVEAMRAEPGDQIHHGRAWRVCSQ